MGRRWWSRRLCEEPASADRTNLRMEQDIAHLESLLSQHVQAFLKAVEVRNEEQQIEQLRWTYSVLARLLDYRLNDRDDWPAGGWVDDIADFRDFLPMESTPPGVLNLHGLMIWGKTGGQWIEPFSASIRYSSPNWRLLSYELKCGDPVRGLGKLEYGRRVRRWPQTWIFEFESQF
jgi:hypothetical protein